MARPMTRMTTTMRSCCWLKATVVLYDELMEIDSVSVTWERLADVLMRCLKSNGLDDEVFLLFVAVASGSEDVRKREERKFEQRNGKVEELKIEKRSRAVERDKEWASEWAT